MTNYEEKKHGFRLTKADHEARDKQKKQERFLNQIAKIDPQQAQKDLDILNRSAFLAPHQQERRKLLERAVAYFRREAASAEEAKQARETEAANAAVAVQLSVAGSASGHPAQRRKRQRSQSDDDSDLDDETVASSSRTVEVDDSRVHSMWSSVLSTSQQSAGVSVGAAGLNSSNPAKSLSFVPRVVARKEHTPGSTTSTQGLQAEVERKMLEAAKGHKDEDMDDFFDNL